MPSPSAEEADLQAAQLAASLHRAYWPLLIAKVGAPVTSFWLMYCVYKQIGVIAAVASFLGLSLIYALGIAPMFAVAATALCFYFHVIGFWLPLLAYITAFVLLIVSLRVGALSRGLFQ